MVFVIVVNLFITSFIGMVTRYFFEYMLFVVVFRVIKVLKDLMSLETLKVFKAET